MSITQKALYNSLRINWLKDRSLEVSPWKVQDYRVLETNTLFEALASLGVFVDRNTFFVYANECDSPEELTDCFATPEDLEVYDRVYLIVFELWRRLLPETPSISIICDELDYQIFCYDQGTWTTLEALEDIIGNFLAILQENVDYETLEPEEAFISLSECCAHDVASFLYDYIADQLDEGSSSFASELVEEFYEFIPDKKWFDFLSARITAETNFVQASNEIAEILETYKDSEDFSLYLDMLTFLVQGGRPELFTTIAEKSLKLLEVEDDFVELLSIGCDFFHCLDKEEPEKKIEEIIESRKDTSLDAPISSKEKNVLLFAKILKESQNTR